MSIKVSADLSIDAPKLSDAAVARITSQMVQQLATSLISGDSSSASAETEGFRIHIKIKTDTHKNGGSTHRNGSGGTTVDPLG